MTSITLDGLKKENYVIMLNEKKKLFFFRKIFSYVNTEKYFHFSQHEYIPKCSSRGLHPKSTAIKFTKNTNNYQCVPGSKSVFLASGIEQLCFLTIPFANHMDRIMKEMLFQIFHLLWKRSLSSQKGGGQIFTDYGSVFPGISDIPVCLQSDFI